MKPIGVIKQMDDLGRLVIPSLVREHFNFQTNDLLACSYKKGYLIVERASGEQSNARKMDRLGRLLIPHQLRTEYDLHPGDNVEFYTQANRIGLKRVKNTRCQVTGKTDEPVFSLLNGQLQVSQEGLDILYQDLQQLLDD